MVPIAYCLSFNSRKDPKSNGWIGYFHTCFPERDAYRLTCFHVYNMGDVMVTTEYGIRHWKLYNNASLKRGIYSTKLRT